MVGLHGTGITKVQRQPLFADCKDGAKDCNRNEVNVVILGKCKI